MLAKKATTMHVYKLHDKDNTGTIMLDCNQLIKHNKVILKKETKHKVLKKDDCLLARSAN